MAFKSMTEHNEQRFKGLFLLQNDGDYADVVFMYSKADDVLVADGVHYIKSLEYTGYVHCCGSSCPACGRGIRLQTRLFVPLYIIGSNSATCTPGEIVFFDRSTRFEAQLQQDVFSKYPDPSQIVFRITRNGAAGDLNTKYSIVAKARNPKTFAEILSLTGAQFPDKYNDVCREVSASVLGTWVNTSNNGGEGGVSNSADNLEMYNIPDYQVTPRGAAPVPGAADVVPVGDTLPELSDITSDTSATVSTETISASATPAVSKSKEAVSATDSNLAGTDSVIPELPEDDVKF